MSSVHLGKRRREEQYPRTASYTVTAKDFFHRIHGLIGTSNTPSSAATSTTLDSGVFIHSFAIRFFIS